MKIRCPKVGELIIFLGIVEESVVNFSNIQAFQGDYFRLTRDYGKRWLYSSPLTNLLFPPF
jgi:hypothetical protein